MNNKALRAEKVIKKTKIINNCILIFRQSDFQAAGIFIRLLMVSCNILYKFFTQYSPCKL